MTTSENPAPEPGWKTTEFWGTLAVSVVALASALGLLSEELATVAKENFATLIQSIAGLWAVYAAARAAVKRAKAS